MSTAIQKVVRDGPARVPLSKVGNRVWVHLDGALVLARIAVDEGGVFLERVLSRESSQSGNQTQAAH